MGKIIVLRLGHRVYRDRRITTHVGLVARAFGADGIILSGEHDENVIKSLKNVVEKWGGPFSISYEKNWLKIIRDWKNQGIVIHLTMYGINLPDIIEKLRELYKQNKNFLIIVGAEKVPSIIFELADYNVAIGNQPHSEVAALAVFLDWLFTGKELTKELQNAEIKIIPSSHEKKIIRKKK